MYYIYIFEFHYDTLLMLNIINTVVMKNDFDVVNIHSSKGI